MNTMGFLNQKNNDKNQSPLVPIKFQHSIVFGETGSGKTTSFIYPNIVHRMHENHGLLIYDFKGKEHLSIKSIAQKQDKLKNIIELGKPYSAKTNILSNVSEANFKKLMQMLMGKDMQWWEHSAISLSVSVFRILRLFNQINKHFSINEVTFDWYSDVPFNLRKGTFEELSDDMQHYQYSIDTTFANIHHILKDLKSFIVWIEGIENLLESMSAKIREKFFGKNPDEDNGFIAISNFDKIKTEYEMIASFRGLTYKPSLDKRASGNNGVLLPLQSIFKSYADVDYLNYTGYDSLNICYQLNKGKIVIINTQSFSDSLLNILTESIFEDLTRRIKQQKKQAISIFIDEAQRVLNPEFELPVDVLREAKVDVFLATQSEYLLKESIGAQRWLSLDTNITQKYNFRNNANEFDYLKDHQYYYQHKVVMANPLFINQAELMKNELIFQYSFKIQKKYNLQKSEYIDFDEILYEKENKYLIRDFQTNKERHIVVINNNEDEKKLIINRFLSGISYEEAELNKEIDSKFDMEIAEILSALDIDTDDGKKEFEQLQSLSKQKMEALNKKETTLYDVLFGADES